MKKYILIPFNVFEKKYGNFDKQVERQNELTGQRDVFQSESELPQNPETITKKPTSIQTPSLEQSGVDLESRDTISEKSEDISNKNEKAVDDTSNKDNNKVINQEEETFANIENNSSGADKQLNEKIDEKPQTKSKKTKQKKRPPTKTAVASNYQTRKKTKHGAELKYWFSS